MLRPEAKDALLAIIHANSDSFTELVDAARLDRARDFRRAKLSDVDLHGERLNDFDFTDADLSFADVRGADFTHATGLDHADLTGVIADAATRWPAGFRPIGAMVLIPPGRFMMGTTKAEHRREKAPKGVYDDELPRHEVSFATGFLLGRYPVTVGEFRRFVTESDRDMSGDVFGWNTEKHEFERSDRYNWANPGFAQDDLHPVTCVSHEDAEAYADWLSKRTGKQFRLPTEAEWEYACRAGTRTARFWGDDRAGAAKFANVADQSLAAALHQDAGDSERFFEHDDGWPFTSPVGAFQPNDWGLYDILGNVWEWCLDHHAPYRGTPRDGTAHTTSDRPASRVLRGGAWLGIPRGVRAGSRVRDRPSVRGTNIGFRLARTLSAS